MGFAEYVFAYWAILVSASYLLSAANQDAQRSLRPTARYSFMLFTAPMMYGLFVFPIYGFFVMPWWQPIVGSLLALLLGIAINVAVEYVPLKREPSPFLVVVGLAAVVYGLVLYVHVA